MELFLLQNFACKSKLIAKLIQRPYRCKEPFKKNVYSKFMKPLLCSNLRIIPVLSVTLTSYFLVVGLSSQEGNMHTDSIVSATIIVLS